MDAPISPSARNISRTMGSLTSNIDNEIGLVEIGKRGEDKKSERMHAKGLSELALVEVSDDPGRINGNMEILDGASNSSVGSTDEIRFTPNLSPPRDVENIGTLADLGMGTLRREDDEPNVENSGFKTKSNRSMSIRGEFRNESIQDYVDTKSLSAYTDVSEYKSGIALEGSDYSINIAGVGIADKFEDYHPVTDAKSIETDMDQSSLTDYDDTLGETLFLGTNSVCDEADISLTKSVSLAYDSIQLEQNKNLDSKLIERVYSDKSLEWQAFSNGNEELTKDGFDHNGTVSSTRIPSENTDNNPKALWISKNTEGQAADAPNIKEVDGENTKKPINGEILLPLSCNTSQDSVLPTFESIFFSNEYDSSDDIEDSFDVCEATKALDYLSIWHNQENDYQKKATSNANIPVDLKYVDSRKRVEPAPASCPSSGFRSRVVSRSRIYYHKEQWKENCDSQMCFSHNGLSTEKVTNPNYRTSVLDPMRRNTIVSSKIQQQKLTSERLSAYYFNKGNEEHSRESKTFKEYFEETKSVHNSHNDNIISTLSPSATSITKPPAVERHSSFSNPALIFSNEDRVVSTDLNLNLLSPESEEAIHNIWDSVDNESLRSDVILTDGVRSCNIKDLTGTQISDNGHTSNISKFNLNSPASKECKIHDHISDSPYPKKLVNEFVIPIKNITSPFKQITPSNSNIQHQEELPIREMSSLIPDPVSSPNSNLVANNLKLDMQDRGQIYLVFKSLSLTLQEIAYHKTQFSIEFDDGKSVIQTEWQSLPGDGNAKLNQEYSITVTDYSHSVIHIKVKCKFECPGRGMSEVVERAPVKKRFGLFSRNKFNKILGRKVDLDPWHFTFARDGSIGRCRFDLDGDQMKQAQYKKNIITCDLINEWKRQIPETKLNDIDDIWMLPRIEPYVVGSIQFELFYLPRTTPYDLLPRSVKTVNEIVEGYKTQQFIEHEGYMWQESGDVSSLTRRFFVLSGPKLVAHHEISKKPKAVFNLLKVNKIFCNDDVIYPDFSYESRGFRDLDLIGHSITICFENGEEIKFNVETQNEKEGWVSKLEQVVRLNMFHHSWVKKMIQN